MLPSAQPPSSSRSTPNLSKLLRSSSQRKLKILFLYLMRMKFPLKRIGTRKATSSKVKMTIKKKETKSLLKMRKMV